MIGKRVVGEINSVVFVNLVKKGWINIPYKNSLGNFKTMVSLQNTFHLLKKTCIVQLGVMKVRGYPIKHNVDFRSDIFTVMSFNSFLAFPSESTTNMPDETPVK